MTANFIADRAFSIAYEAVHYPNTAEMGITWILRAMLWARKRALAELEEDLRANYVYIAANMALAEAA